MPCNQSVLGSYLACWNASIKAPGNVDYPWGAPEISYPTDGTPWGAHITGPYPDGTSCPGTAVMPPPAQPPA